MKKVLLFVLMITLVVSCAVTGVAFASSASSNYYTANFTTEALRTAPGYLVFDKPLDATDGKTITMTMDIESGTDLTNMFNLGFAILPSIDADGLKANNALVWYNSTVSQTGKRNKGSLITSGEEITGNQASGLYYKTNTHIKEDYSIKVEYVAPTESADGSIALYKKTNTATTWTLVNKYQSIKYDSMSQSESLYFAIMGWWESGAKERSLVFLNPRVTDGTTVSTSIKSRGSVNYSTPTEIDNGNGFVLYADKYTNAVTPIDTAYSYVYFTHDGSVIDNDGKFTTGAVVDFDVIANNGLQLILNDTKTVPDTDTVKVAIPALEATTDTEVLGQTTRETKMKPTGRYEVKFVGSKAVTYAHYDVTVKATTVVEGQDDVVEVNTTTEIVKLSETEMTLDNYYIGFMIETSDAPKFSTVDNIHVADDPNATGVFEYEYRFTFEEELNETTFYADKTGDNSVAKVTTRAHTVSVTDGSIIGKDVYTMLVEEGELIEFKADAPKTGYHFDRWEKSDGTVYSRNEQVSIIAVYNLSLTAKYERNDYEITLVNPDDKITFYEGEDVSLSTINVKYGDSIKIVAHNNDTEGYVFDGWYNGNEKVSSDKVYKFEASTDYKALEAKYALAQINVKVVNGVAKADTDVNALNTFTKDWGTQVTATPNTAKTGLQFDHWEFNDVKIDANSLGNDNSYAFELKESGTLTAVYTKIKYLVSVVDGYIDGDSEVDEKEIEHGEQVIITANAPAEGKQFDGWYSGDEKVSSDLDYVVTVESAISVEAKCVDKTDDANSGCAGFIAPPTSNGGGNNSLWLIAGMLVLSAVAVAIARRSRTAKESK